MGRIGLYLSGAGSLDGSDIFTAVLSYKVIQSFGYEPVPIGRDVEQGEVSDHRTAQRQETTRNSLVESARIVRGSITDMRDVDATSLDAGVLVGGGGTLSTWMDYHQRGPDCRITEHLKFQIIDAYRNSVPIFCLDNACVLVAYSLSDITDTLIVNPGGNTSLIDLVESWNVQVSDESPVWDSDHLIGSLPNLVKENDLTKLEKKIRNFIKLGLGEL